MTSIGYEEGARPALESDLAALTRLAGQAIEELSGQRGGALWLARHARPADDLEGSLRASLADPATCLLAGTIDGAVVGYASATVETVADGGRLAVVTDLFTEPDARKVGVGEAMMNAVLEWAGAQGCFGVDSLALPGDRHTKNFFESFGLVARAILVHRALDGR